MDLQKWARAPLANIRAENGVAYIALTGLVVLSSHERPSQAIVLEDGTPLPGPANALHDEIRTLGHGRYSFWHEQVYFSASDNSDPRTNGRVYEFAYPPISSRVLIFLSKIFLKPSTREQEKNTPSSEEQSGESGSESIQTPVFQYIPWQTEMWERIGLKVSKEANLLDLGCGEGECVHQFRQAGYSISGCDISFPAEPQEQLRKYLEAGEIRKIQMIPYRLPFEDNSFDIVFSHQVFEHVMDYEGTLAEIKRVLKPDGYGVHIFPGRWKIRESHVYVPFASIIRSYWWLYFWALTGIRNEYQAGFSAQETANRNKKYLTQETNYLSRRQICRCVNHQFKECRFVEEAYFYPRYEKWFKKYPFLLPLYRAWFSDTDMRVLVFGNKK